MDGQPGQPSDAATWLAIQTEKNQWGINSGEEPSPELLHQNSLT